MVTEKMSRADMCGFAELKVYEDAVTVSRHAIVCRAAQETAAPHRGYTDRMKRNVIFTPLFLGDPLSDWNHIC